jgi:hypothetical protein
VDHGPSAATGRYIVRLGDIDVTAAGIHGFSMSGLPPEEFILGLEVAAGTGSRSRSPRQILVRWAMA